MLGAACAVGIPYCTGNCHLSRISRVLRIPRLPFYHQRNGIPSNRKDHHHGNKG